MPEKLEYIPWDLIHRGWAVHYADGYALGYEWAAMALRHRE